ncbi:MAG: phosphoglucosamine mutase [Rickettsiales bacterium]|nr:phosphoglucosamine mutase [Rickettsiales bacterium]
MSERKFFGTDGIRGTANKYPMKASIALRLGKAAGHYFTRGNHRHRVVIAKDTRLSGYMIENALTAGFLAAGMDVILVGPMPTPAVAMLTKSMRADLGVMISASHNPYHDNGLKLFGPDGFKLSDKAEIAIEELMQTDDVENQLADPSQLGRAKRIEDAPGRYIEFAKATFPTNLDLSGLRIVIDCANGAAYKVAPTVLQELGAEIVPIGIAPDGFNVNKDCGSTHPEAMQKMIRESRADIGIALDGDADRLIICDEKSNVIDGDQIIAMIATEWQRMGILKHDAVVTTQMSNLGLEQYFKKKNITLFRTNVGDRYVVQKMREGEFNLGGEQSGHIVMSDYATTGDGLIGALQVLAVLQRQQKSASEALNLFTPLPQILRNVRYSGADPLEKKPVIDAIVKAEKALSKNGRLFIRKSGTEPLIRIMAEGDDQGQIDTLTAELAEIIENNISNAA